MLAGFRAFEANNNNNNGNDSAGNGGSSSSLYGWGVEKLMGVGKFSVLALVCFVACPWNGLLTWCLK